MEVVKIRRVALLFAGIALGLPVACASAAEFTVNSTADTNACAATCSLRGAIEAADASSDATNTVTVPAGVYDLAPADKANPNHVGQLRLTNGPGTTLTINGAGKSATVINADQGDRVLRAGGGGADLLTGMTFEGGRPSESDGGSLEESARGAGILQIGGTLKLQRMLVGSNGDSGWAGGVDVEGNGTLELIESELDNDVSTSGGGGGASLEPGRLIATGSSFLGDNSLAGTGGAVQLLKGSTAKFTNDTMAQDGFLHSGDTYEGGAVYLESSSAEFFDVTFSDDAAFGNTHGGADVSANEGSHVSFQNVLLGAGTGGEPGEQACNEIFNTVGSMWTDLGGNLSADAGVALGLGELADNGGRTQTVPLLAGSPAIDHGVLGCPASDQRGYARVGTCDSGAFEFAARPPVVDGKAAVTETAKHEPVPVGQSAQVAERVLLGCGKSKLVLNDVYTHGHHVMVRGSATKSFAGKRVRIVLNGRRQVASAVVKADGQFSTTAPLPAAHGRLLAATRYLAQLGKLRSLNLKLTRRLVLEAPTSKGTAVTLSGQLEPPLTKPVTPVVIEQELACGTPTIVKSFPPPRSGRYHVSLSVPSGTKAAIFRIRSRVAADAHSLKHGFATYSLPLPVAIGTEG